MSDAEWKDWTGYHATLFWMKTPEDAAMFGEWRRALSGYSLAELREASLWIASDQVASAAFRSRHLGLLHGRIQSKRHARRQADIDALERSSDANRCNLCDGIGLVAVPHLRCVAGGQWVYPYAEQVVACGCQLGRYRLDSVAAAIHELNQRGNRPKKNFDLISLERYEAILTARGGLDWLVLAENRKSERAAHTRAAALASQADKSQPIDLRRVLSRIGKQ